MVADVRACHQGGGQVNHTTMSSNQEQDRQSSDMRCNAIEGSVNQAGGHARPRQLKAEVHGPDLTAKLLIRSLAAIELSKGQARSCTQT